MIFNKKFYDAQEATGGSETATVEASETTTQEQPKETEVKEEKPESVAAIMAKHGIKTNDSKVAKPIVNKEKTEETKQAEGKTTVETTKETPKADLEEPKSQQTEEKPTVQPQKEETTKAAPTLQEVLKSQQPDNVLKELGFDDKTVKLVNKLKGFEKIDFFANLVDEWQKKGDLKGYLKELTTDYQKMSPEEVMRHQLREEYPKASEQALNALFKKKIVQAYNLDSEDESEIEEGKMLLEAEADKYRDTLIERQKTKLFPEVPEVPEIDPEMELKKAQQELDSYKSTVLDNDFSKDVFENKRIVIGKGKSAFTYPIEPEAIQNVLFDDDAWRNTQFKTETDAQGNIRLIPKTETQILTAAFALNPEKFLKEYAKHYEALGSDKTVESIDNAKPKEQPSFSAADTKPKNAAEAMAKHGRLVTGGA